jgi:hypothetical protein
MHNFIVIQAYEKIYINSAGLCPNKNTGGGGGPALKIKVPYCVLFLRKINYICNVMIKPIIHLKCLPESQTMRTFRLLLTKYRQYFDSSVYAINIL